MYNKATKDDILSLGAIVGEKNVLTGGDINPDYAHDELGGIEKMPEVLVRVRSTEEISAVMRHAYAREIPVTVRGSGTGLVGGISQPAGFFLRGGFMLLFGRQQTEHLLCKLCTLFGDG